MKLSTYPRLIRHHIRFVLWGLSLILWGGMASVSYAAGVCENQEGKIVRSLFTTQLENREPQDRVLVLENKATEVFFFTELTQLQGHTITHRWEYEGRVVYTKSYEIKGPRWRAVSRKELDPSMTGRWSVIVVDENNCPYKAGVFQYVQASTRESQQVILPP